MPEYKSLGNTIREAVFKAKEAPTMLPDETIEKLELQEEDVLDLSEKTSEEEEEEERRRHAQARSREQAQHDRKLEAGSKQDQEAEKKRHKAAKDLEQRRHVYDRRSKEKFAGKRTTSVEHVETVDEATPPSGPKATRPASEKTPPAGPKNPNQPNVKKPAPKKPPYRPRRAHHIGGRDHAFWRAEKTHGEEVELENDEQIDENLGYASSKDGSQTFVVSKRKRGNPYKAHGTDSVSMAVVDSKTGKTIKDWGSHIDLKSATIFAKNKGFTNMKSTAPAGLPKKAYEDVELDEAIWAKNVGQDAIRQIRAATPPYTVVAIKGKKVVDQSKPIMVSNQVPAFIHDFIKKNSDEALTIGVEDKSGQMVYTYHKPRGVRREETEIDEGGMNPDSKVTIVPTIRGNRPKPRKGSIRHSQQLMVRDMEARAKKKKSDKENVEEEGMIGRTKPSRELNVSREEKPHLAGKSSLKDKKRAAHKSERAKTGAALGRALKALKAKRGDQ